MAGQIKNKKAEAEIFDELGNLYRTLASRENSGEKKTELLRTALEYNETALRIQEGFEGDPAGLANRHQELARTLLALGKIEEAQRHFKDAIRFARDAKRQHLEAWQFRRMGDTFKKLARKAEMILCYTKALELDPREMRHLKGTVADALRALDSDARQVVVMRLKALSGEIEKLLIE